MQDSGSKGEGVLPIRLTDGARVATWNPGLARATRVVLQVRDGGGALSERISMNSGRARVREGERIEAVRAMVDSS